MQYAFDGLNRLQQAIPLGGAPAWGAGSGTTTYTYTDFGALATAALPANVTAAYAYDNAHRLTGITHAQNTLTLSQYAYTLDKVGNRAAVTEAIRQPVTVSIPDALFADGFESGNLSGWSSNANGSGRLSATTAAALAGTYGMQAQFNATTTAIYVQDTQPTAEPRYRVRFYFDPNGAGMANGSTHFIFFGDSGATGVLRVELRCDGAASTCPASGNYQLRISALPDGASTFTNSAWVNIADAPHVIEVDWQASTAPGANDGSLGWWIDETAQAGLSGIDNDTRRIDRVRLGLVAGIDASTTGAHYFDAFESRRQTFIGSGADLPDGLFGNDFESGNFAYWTSTTTPSLLSVTGAAALAPVGSQGLQVSFDGVSTAGRFVTDATPTFESRYRARFYFDPNSIVMNVNTDHVLFFGDSSITGVVRVELKCAGASGVCPASGSYQLRAGALPDGTTLFANTGWVNITDGPHVIEVDWQASSAPGANNGSLSWWIDETPQTGLSSIDNDTRKIDRARLGATANVDTSTNGTLYFDAFESHRSTYIGPMVGALVTTTINYLYDPLYRLKEANYFDGRYFHYTYDAVGNRLTETKCDLLPCGTPAVNNYVYDVANRLTSVNSQTYIWDDNGNLLNDGTNTYAYDAANRLTSVVGGGNTSTYAYNSLNDRVSQTVNAATTNYVLDLNTGLTQVLNDGTNTYLYGNARIGEQQASGFVSHLGDALGSVRQLADAGANVTLARSYEPYGSVLSSAGTGSTVMSFTGEILDSTGLQYHRARYYASSIGRFLTADTWPGSYIKLPTPTGGIGSDPNQFVTDEWPDDTRPLTLNGWNYVEANPINFTDPSGHQSIPGHEPSPGQAINTGLSRVSWDGPCVGGYTLRTTIDFFGHVTVQLVPCETQETVPGNSPLGDNCGGRPKEMDNMGQGSANHLSRQCESILKDIKKRLATVQRRYNEWVINAKGLRDRGHRKVYENEQIKLGEALEKWDRHNCGDLPADVADAPDWVTNPLPD